MRFASLTLIVLLSVGAAYSVARVVAITIASGEGLERLSGLERALTWTPSAWRYHYDLGSVARAVGQYDHALLRFDAAIARFPACGICWVARAETEAAMGVDPTDSILQAVKHGRSQTGVRTRTAVLYAKLGRQTEALREFGAAAGGQVDNPYEFFSVLHRLYETQQILDAVVPHWQLAEYFTYARKYLDAESTALVWNRLSTTPESVRHRRYYANDLLRRGTVHAAWRTSFGADAPVGVDLFDGDFSGKHDRHPWGWRIEEVEGVRVDTARCADCEVGDKALRLKFGGDHNPDFHGVVQYIPVLPGAAYLLKARVKYQGLTSARGPSLFVDGITGAMGTSARQCRLRIAGEELLRDSDWRVIQVAFVVPAACEGVRVMVARRKTNKLDRYIRGELWVDHMHLEILSTPSKSVEEPAE
jgi:tetratricopeptide (TPR) repeat protein